MSVAVTLRMSVQTAHDTWQYSAVETRVFPDTASLREVMNWASDNGQRHPAWSDLLFTRVTLAEGAQSEGKEHSNDQR